jgi:FlaA1/EpsC-like NDP-sugar epimerase
MRKRIISQIGELAIWKFVVANRFPFIFLVAISAIVGSLYSAFLLRFDFSLPPSELENFWKLLGPAVVVKSGVFWRFDLYKGWWRYASISDLVDIGKTTVWSSAGLVLFVVFIYRFEGIPRSVLILDAGITFGLLAGIRFITRIVREYYLPFFLGENENDTRVLIIGAGESGQNIVRDIRKSRTLRYKMIGFLDDDPLKKHGRFQGLSVLGNTDKVQMVCQSHNVDEIIIAVPIATSSQMRRIVELTVGAGAKVRTLPAMSDLIDNNVTVQQIRDVDVRDLLGRHPVRLDVEKICSYVEGKRVLVTGAAGSIGSEICRQLTRFSPKTLILLDHAESPLFFLDRELAALFEGEIYACIADTRHQHRMEAVFKDFQPEVIFHAAAYKHVPMMEHNPEEAIGTNVQGTRIVADLAGKYGAESFVMISTDKAVNPTNIMGATKRCAEIYVQSLGSRVNTLFTTVRFGNVLASAGSVIPIFRSQIEAGGPVTVTDPEVTRFFMTIPEATQLVLQAGSMGQGGEIFLLKMGEPIKIRTLAEELIKLSGFTLGEEIKIEYTGLRPGEKLYEELLLDGEGIANTSHESIRIAAAQQYDYDCVAKQIEGLFRIPHELGREGVIDRLKEIVPEFVPALNGSGVGR